MKDLDLIDIEGIVDIGYTNPLWYLFAFIVALFLLLSLYFLIYRRERVKFKLSKEELAKRRVESIDYSDPKSIAYIFSEDVAIFIDESRLDRYNSIERKLEEFKYKRDIPDMPNSLKDEIKAFIKGIKWQI